MAVRVVVTVHDHPRKHFHRAEGGVRLRTIFGHPDVYISPLGFARGGPGWSASLALYSQIHFRLFSRHESALSRDGDPNPGDSSQWGQNGLNLATGIGPTQGLHVAPQVCSTSLARSALNNAMQPSNQHAICHAPKPSETDTRPVQNTGTGALISYRYPDCIIACMGSGVTTSRTTLETHSLLTNP